MADIPRSILGVDFPHLLVDIRWLTVTDGTLAKATVGKHTFTRLIEILNFLQDQGIIAELLKDFPAITKLGNLRSYPQHQIRYHIVTTGPPVNSQCRHFTPDLLQAAKAELHHAESWHHTLLL